MADCAPLDFICHAKGKTGEIVTDLTGSAMEKIAASIGEAVADGLTAVGTLWINIGTPNLSSTGTSPQPTGAPGIGQIEQILGYVTYVGLFVCILSLMVAGVRLARPGSTNVADEGARIGIVLMATILISGAAALVGGLAQGVDRSTAGNGATGFLQNSLWPYTLALAVVSVLVAATKMAWEQRAQPGRDLVKSLLTLILVTGATVPVVGILITASDEFSEWIIRQSLSCDPSSSASCFKDNVADMVAVTAFANGTFMTIVLGLIALFTSLMQIMLMVARSGMLVLLTGLLPLTAAATNTEMGGTWFKRGVAWLVAWLLYKPAAAIIYATAFQLAGSDVFEEDSTGLISVLSGLMLMILAILALPALMRFVTPAVSSMAAGAGGGMAAMAAMSPALGAVSAGGRSMGASTTSAGGSASQASASGSGMSGINGSLGGSGQQGASGPKGGAPSSGGSGAAASSSGASAATAGGGAAAAAGPVGMAVAGAQAAKQGVDTAVRAAASTADGATKSGGSNES